MFDYQTSKHAHFDAACRAFALSHNLEDVAAAVGMRPQILRNKLNPIQPHRLTCDELLAITDYTEDARLLDGMLGQINCLPSVPVNNATEANMQFCALSATANVGAIAGEAVSTEHMTAARRTQILDRARDAIRSLSVLAYTVESRLHSAPVTPIWCCAGLPGTWNAHNLLKTASSVCLSASWSAYSNASGHVPSSTPRCAMWPAG